MKIFVKPAAGVLVRNPENSFAHLPEEGTVVRADYYWHQLAAEGSVTISKDLPSDKPKAAAKAAPATKPAT